MIFIVQEEGVYNKPNPIKAPIKFEMKSITEIVKIHKNFSNLETVLADLDIETKV